MSQTTDATIAELTLDGFAHGGAAVGRLPDGKACFVEYAIPGERVRVRIVDDRRRWARGELVEVLDASADRVAPPCPFFGPGRCGGCNLQHIAPARQAQLLATVIADQLKRIGHIPLEGQVPVVRPHAGDGFGYRNRARFAVDASGRLAYRRAGSNDVIAVDDCPLLVDAGRDALRSIAAGWRDVREVELRIGGDGQPALVVTSTGGAVPLPTELPAAVIGPRWQPLRVPRIRFEVAGRTFHAGVTSFFQASVAAAEQLVTLVRRMTAVTAGDHVLELYAGVGLFSAFLAGDGARVTAVEGNVRASADARNNTRGLDVTVVQTSVGPGVRLHRDRERVDAVVLDPPRRGAGQRVMSWIAGLEPHRVTYVSCDPATFARDARVLTGAGYHLHEVVGVDQFTHTAHVELVAAFGRERV